MVCIDLIGSYKILQKRVDKNENKKHNLTLWCVTMIDPAIGWFEMVEIKTKCSDVIANIIVQMWLNRCPWPTKFILENGRELMAEFSQMIQWEYGINKRLIKGLSPQ